MSLKLWQSRFGDDYHTRNVVTDNDVKNREVFWSSIFNSMGSDFPKTILEVGAGNGINIQAIKNLYDRNGHEVELNVVEPNNKARENLYQQGIVRKPYTGIDIIDGSRYDLVFTSGVLIHIPPDQLLDFTKKMYSLSNKWIVCAEYFRPEPETKPYRGQDDALFLRDFGAFWLDNFPLQCVSYGFAWARLMGIDNITWQLLKKVN